MTKLQELEKEFNNLQKRLFGNCKFAIPDNSQDWQRYDQLKAFFHPEFRTESWVNPIFADNIKGRIIIHVVNGEVDSVASDIPSDVLILTNNTNEAPKRTSRNTESKDNYNYTANSMRNLMKEYRDKYNDECRIADFNLFFEKR